MSEKTAVRNIKQHRLFVYDDEVWVVGYFEQNPGSFKNPFVWAMKDLGIHHHERKRFDGSTMVSPKSGESLDAHLYK